MHEWIHKEGYKTRLLADEADMDVKGAQLQLVRFKEGKYVHYHKKRREFFYFTKGNGKVIINGAEKKIEPGSTFLIKPRVRHAFVNESKELLEAIMFKTNDSKDDTYSE